MCLGLGNLNVDEMVELCINHDTENDWTFGLSKEYLKKHAIDWYSANEMLKKECPKYKIKYYDTSKDRIKCLNNIINIHNIKGYSSCGSGNKYKNCCGKNQ